MNKLSSIFGQTKGAVFFGYDSEVIEPLTGGKKNPMQGKIIKRTIGAVALGNGSYANARNKQLTAQGFKATFVAQSRTWGEKVKGLPVVTHKGSVYLNTMVLHAGKVAYFKDGKPIAKEDIEGLKVSKGTGISVSDMDKQLATMTDKQKLDLAAYQEIITEALNNPDSIQLDAAILAAATNSSKAIYPRDYKAISIQAIRVNKQEYKGIHSTEV